MLTSFRRVLICSLPVLIHLFSLSSYLQTLGKFKHGCVFHMNNLNLKSCAFSNIHQTFTPFQRQYCHNVMNQSFVCLHLNDCSVFVQSDVLRVLMNFKLVEVRYFCVDIHLHAYTVMLKRLTALQSTTHDCLNKTLIPKSMK